MTRRLARKLAGKGGTLKAVLTNRKILAGDWPEKHRGLGNNKAETRGRQL
jgi:hypothetical protein